MGHLRSYPLLEHREDFTEASRRLNFQEMSDDKRMKEERKRAAYEQIQRESVGRGYSEAMSGLVRRCLEIDPGKRPTSRQLLDIVKGTRQE